MNETKTVPLPPPRAAIARIDTADDRVRAALSEALTDHYDVVLALTAVAESNMAIAESNDLLVVLGQRIAAALERQNMVTAGLLPANQSIQRVRAALEAGARALAESVAAERDPDCPVCAPGGAQVICCGEAEEILGEIADALLVFG